MALNHRPVFADKKVIGKSFCRSGSQTLFFGGREATTGNASAVRRLGVFELVLKNSSKSEIVQIKFQYTAEIIDGNLFLIYALQTSKKIP